MVFKGKIDCDTRARVFYLRHVQGLSVRKVADICDVSRGSVLRIAQESRESKRSRKTLKKGRPRKLTDRQRRLIIRSVSTLRNEEGNFSAKRIMEKSGIDNGEVSVRTVTRLLNENGFFYLQARKKGLLMRDDLKKGYLLPNCAKKIIPPTFGLRIYRSFWMELVLHTKQIPLIKLAHQRGGHGGNYQRDLH